MRAVRALAVTLALVAGGAWPVVGPAAPACAGAGGPHAALVVDAGTRVHAFCVELDASEVTGLHLIELAASQHGLSYGFGLGGAAVCRLAGVGPEGSDCFADYPAFWGYWHGGSTGWTWASTGAGSHRLGNGDVDGWVWGDGDTPTTHREPPPRTFDELCREAQPAPSPTASPSTRPSPPAGPGGGAGPSSDSSDVPTSAGGGGSSGGGGSTASDGSRTAGDTGGPVAGSPSGGTPLSTETAAGGQPPPGGGPPLGLFLAGALGAALLAGGWLRSRSRPGGAP